MAWEPHLTVRAVKPVVDALGILGHPVETILADASIARSVLADPDGEVSHRAMMLLWERASAVSGDDHLGIHLAEAAPIASFEVHAYALLSSPTLREAYRRGCRFQRLIHEATRLTFDEEGEEGILSHALASGSPVPRHPAEFLVTVWVRLGRLVTGDLWSPSQVCFAHDEPADAREHARVFGANVQFRTGRTALHIPASVLDRVNPRADPGLVQVLDRYAGALLAQKPLRTTFSGRVQAWLAEAHGGGAPTAAEAAKALFVSVRTLHRSLQEEGTTFRELLDHLRREQSMTLLARRDCSIAEVAFLLGFSELSSFYRAFRRWTGQTPAEFRVGRSGQ